MEDEDGNITGQDSSQSIPNNTTTKSVERTSTQKLSFPILEKNDHTSAKLKEIPSQFRDQLEEEVKDVFIWTISDHGNDKDGKRKRTKFSTLILTLHTFQTSVNSRAEQTPQHSRFLQDKTRTGGISCRNLETHSRN